MITVFGSVNIDVTAYSERLPRPGETIHGERYLTGLGGKGANQAAAAARLGAAVKMIGRTGADGFGASARAALTGFGVDVSSLTQDAEGATGIAIIAVDAKGENTITVIGGANLRLTRADAAAARSVLAASRVLLLQNEIPPPAAIAAAEIARAAGASVILDPAPAPKHGLPDELWRLASIITPNETETEALTGIRPETAADAAEAARILHAKGIAAAVVKLGSRGVLASDGRESRFIPPFTVKTIDSVAAGDCFNGALAVALTQGQPLPAAVRFAAAAGALSTTRYGAAASAPARAEVEALLLANPPAGG